MTGNDDYKAIEDSPDPAEELIREPSAKSKTLWDQISQYDLDFKIMRWEPFIFTGVSLFGMYALKYFVVPPSPRTLLRRRIAVGLGCAYLSYSSYGGLHFAKELCTRIEQGGKNELGELSPMWVGVLHLMMEHERMNSAMKAQQRNVEFNSLRELYAKFRAYVPAETLSERIFRQTRTWFSNVDQRAFFFSILFLKLQEVECSPREIDISVSLAALCCNLGTINNVSTLMFV
ncbi:hypothetical protein K474DRAFT_1659708 [Panus rudis PR-1116 ss-1]|nr:hypothetical protein K474DRAFT_1659708 [Panus rudis PR-1116 ss-1]